MIREGPKELTAWVTLRRASYLVNIYQDRKFTLLQGPDPFQHELFDYDIDAALAIKDLIFEFFRARGKIA